MSKNKLIQDELFIGVDCHKKTHYLVAINLKNKIHASFQFTNTQKGIESCIKKLCKLREKYKLNIGLEGAYGLGKHLAKSLIKSKFNVFEVCSALTKSRRNKTSGWDKSDEGDALTVAKIVRDEEYNLPLVVFNKAIEAIAQITKLREGLVIIRTENYNKLHAKLLQLDPQYLDNGAIVNVSTLAFWLEYCDSQLDKEKDICKKALLVSIKTLVESIQNLSTQIKEIEKDMKNYETDDSKRLQTIPGIGRIAAFTILAEIGDPKRFKTSAQLASYGGISPVTFASGSSSFTKLNRRGSRRLNCIFDRVALTASQRNEFSAMYYQKKLDEGKTSKQARKYLARRLLNIVFALLKNKTNYDPNYKPLAKKIKEYKSTWAKTKKKEVDQKLEKKKI